MEEIELKFETESIEALKFMENTNKCIYLTGKAGAGKSTIVNYFISKTKKKFALLGTTGISAINIGGQTIHKFFGLVPNKKTFIKSKTKNIIKNTDIFIIDEISMMRADLFDKIDTIMRMVMGNDLFMGGKQFVFVGDLFQLPPVPERDEELKKYYQEKYKGLFFFDGNSYIKEHFKIIELKKVYRQENPQFINMLNRLRIGDKSLDLLNYFNNKVVKEDQINPKAILIGTTNKIVNIKNSLELSKLPGKESISVAYISGEYPEEIYPTERVIKIKKGARIMFTVNHKLGDYVNGTLGTVLDININSNGFINIVKIETDDGAILKISKNQWTNSIGNEQFGEPIIDGLFIQFPFKLAFAITIHKVQGKSFDNIIVDLGWGAFAEGQVYVALSRCRSYEGLQLLKPITKKDIKVSHHVINFLK